MIPALKISPAQVLTLHKESGDAFQISTAAEVSFLAAQAPIPLHWDTREITGDVPCIYFAKAGKKFNPAFQIAAMLEAGHFVIASAADLAHAFSAQRISAMLDSAKLLCTTNVPELLNKASLHVMPSGSENLKSIGITGTNGKTSCTSIICDLIQNAMSKPVARIGTLGFFDGYELYEHAFPTTPDFGTFCRCLNLLLSRGVEYLVMEVSSHGLEERRLGDWKFDVAVLTNITPDHLDYHKNMENYRRAKIKLFAHHLNSKQGQAIVCASRSPWNEVIHSARHAQKCTVLFDSELTNEIAAFKRNKKENERLGSVLEAYSVTCIQESVEYIQFEIAQIEPAATSATNEIVEIVKAPLIGRFQMENIGTSILAAHALGIPISRLVLATQKLKGVPGRLQRVQATSEQGAAPSVFVDYAHSADSLEQTLYSLRTLAKKQKSAESKIIVVFGCGGDRDRLKRPAMGRVATALSDHTIVTSDNPRSEDPARIVDDILGGVEDERKDKVQVELDRKKAIAAAINLAEPNDIVLIAGKGHENYQIIQNDKLPFSDFEVARNVIETDYRKLRI